MGDFYTSKVEVRVNHYHEDQISHEQEIKFCLALRVCMILLAL